MRLLDLYDKALIGFAGFDGPGIALREAGIETVGIEIDAAIAGVNRYNGGNVIRADILDIDPADYIGWLLYHFSPPCPSFSVARNSKALQPMRYRILDLSRHQRVINGENEFDMALARKICEFIRVGRPEHFTLENVWGYRKSQSWLIIWYTLLSEGYGVGAWHLNAVDYGVPQSRRRMIVIAKRDGRQPTKPWPTHSKTGDMFTKPWRGWYEAIKDLIPTLPESRFAPWQMDRLPDELKTYLVMTSNTNRNGVDNVPGRGYLGVDQPANTVNTTGNGSLPRAFLLGQGSRSELKKGDEPADTVTANTNQTGVKALIADSANSNSNDARGTIRGGDEPIFTITTNKKTAFPKAFIVDNQRKAATRKSDEPVFTILSRSGNKQPIRAGFSFGKVISMTPRALARFQDFPDSYILPENRELACRGIGNALPPGLYRAVLRSLDLI